MRVVSASAQEYVKTPDKPYDFIEIIGRTCYKSIRAIGDTPVKFCQRLVNSGHLAIIEHWPVHAVYMGPQNKLLTAFESLNRNSDYRDFPRLYSFMHITLFKERVFLTANLRTFFELDAMFRAAGRCPNVFKPLMSVVCNVYHDLLVDSAPFYDAPNDEVPLWWYLEDEPRFLESIRLSGTYDHRLRDRITHEVMRHSYHTFLFITDRGVTHELVRHRPASFAQESTRFCNYHDGKFDSEVTFIDPRPMFKLHFGEERATVYYDVWCRAMAEAEKTYMSLVNAKANPEEARSVLPNSVKAEIFMTANEIEWQHVIDLRCHGTTGRPHPQMQEVMTLCFMDLSRSSEGRIK